MPNLTSTDYSCEVIYLIKKIGEPFAYTRVKEFEILNTESRAQLFSHAFGYKQKAFDFGVDFETRKQISNLSSPVNKTREESTGIRDSFYREDHPEHLDVAMTESRHATVNQFAMANPQPVEKFTGNEELILRQFVVIRVRKVSHHADDNDLLNSEATCEQPSINRHYAMVTLLQTKRDLDEG